MYIEKHISNLKQYIKDDEIIEKDGSDFANFCKGHIDDIQAVLNELEKKDKVIDLLADDLRYYEGMQQDQLFCIDTCEGKMCDEEHCKERIKEYFYKKVRNNGIKRK